MKLQKIIASGLASVMLMAFLTGCGGENNNGGKTKISISNWPAETQPDTLEKMEGRRDAFMAENSDIEVVGDTWQYDTKTFTMKASANQLPTIYTSWFTEIGMIMEQGYGADITDIVKEYKYDKYINPELLKLATDGDGRIYGLPQSAYAQGLFINKKMFKEAGLVNGDGSIKIPQTYEEVAEFSKIIKEKTGKAGFAIPTINNCGGWHFLNIAWSYGVDFMELEADGKWKATFDTQEMRDALQYIKDLKWKYDALPADTAIDQQGLYKYFGTDQVAMMFADPPRSEMPQKYNMAIDDIYVARMPEGPAGRFSQMGGGIYVFAPQATEEEIRAGFKWLAYGGYTPELDEASIENSKKNYETTVKEGGIVLNREPFPIWVAGGSVEEKQRIREEYANVKDENYAEYYAFENVTINPEPSACAQQLYAILDGCIQEVVSNENADVDALVKEACVDFQVNHLDKM